MSISTIALEERSTGVLAKAADYLELTKPRIAMLVLVTFVVSGVVARWGQPDLHGLLHGSLGMFLIAASASALNQWLERKRDLRMERTANRPLPSGRLSSAEAITFAVVTFVVGLIYLTLVVNWVTALFGVVTWVMYVWVYTPLKPITSLNTAVGAIAGAAPVAMGWTAVGGQVWDLRLLSLFTLVFVWQFPHFMAIAWLYRRQYAHAGLRMLTVVDPSGRRAGVQAVLGALALLPVSLMPAMMSPGAGIYTVLAFVLGVAQLIAAIRFMKRRDDPSARSLLRASLVYLPALLLMLVLVPLI